MKELELNKIYEGDSLEVLKTFPDESIDMCITSPPYWGLRDYGTEGQVWGGDEKCKHEWDGVQRFHPKNGKRDGKGTYTDPKWEAKGSLKPKISSDFCIKCNAWKGELGLEPTPDMFISNLCDIFDEVKRVLKPYGTCWVNLGDSYCRTPNDQVSQKNVTAKYKYGFLHNKKYGEAYKPKSLVQIPSRFAIEMTNRGWILRNEIIWHKPSCLPESVKDRFTNDYEKLYFFSKNKNYYFKQQLEPIKMSSIDRMKYKMAPKTELGIKGTGFKDNAVKAEGRNKRAVWSISPTSFKGAHFATYPPELIESPIAAGCPEFVDKVTGEPRISEVKSTSVERYNLPKDHPSYRPTRYEGKYEQGQRYSEYKDKGYQDGRSEDEFISGVVLDPFFGSGTTGEVAMSQDKDWIGIELNSEYETISETRLKPKIVEKKTRDKAKDFFEFE